MAMREISLRDYEIERVAAILLSQGLCSLLRPFRLPYMPRRGKSSSIAELLLTFQRPKILEMVRHNQVDICVYPYNLWSAGLPNMANVYEKSAPPCRFIFPTQGAETLEGRLHFLFRKLDGLERYYSSGLLLLYTVSRKADSD